MLVTICRQGAVAACVLGFAALAVPGSGRSASAGVVAPAPASDTTTSAANGSSTVVLPSTATDDRQAFWYPGVDAVAVEPINVSSVPVSSNPGAGSVAPLAGGEQHPLIPLPGAASTGMAGLLGLAAIKILRNYRKLLA